MRLLVITQKVDQGDDVLGFFHEWLRQLAERCERVEVVCLYEGAHDLPPNVAVHSLGKEQGAGRVARTLRLYRYLWQLRGQYDAVFVHMNPEYLVLAGWWWRLCGTRTLLWYSHRQVNLKLRVAVLFANAVATAAPESLRIPSYKVRVVGHGIDTVRFALGLVRPLPEAPRIVSVGRITPIKGLETIIQAVLLMRRQGSMATLTLIGAPGSGGDEAYAAALHAQVDAAHDPGAVVFAGSVPNRRMPEEYAKYDLAINACPTGGVDKAVLESMAAGLPTLAANEAFRPYFGGFAEALIFKHGDAQDLTRKLLALPRGTEVGEYLRAQAKAMGDVSVVIGKLLALLD